MNTELTDNQKKAMTALVATCLSTVGAKVVADFAEEYWNLVDASDLVMAGWSQKEAEGTFGSLVAAGLIQEGVWEENQYTLSENFNDLKAYHQ